MEINNHEAFSTCILLGVYHREREQYQVADEMEELESLAEACGYRVEAKKIQKRQRPHASFYVGRGKLEEIAMEASEKKIETIICNDPLSTLQVQHIEQKTGLAVQDRFHLILNIFSKRAFSLEGKLQVKLAELQFQLPRLRGKGIDMSRQRGGIGTRGPGEMKLEQDRRHIQQEMNRIREKLKHIQIQKNTRRKKRVKSKKPLVALVGYTNAGKSSLMNAFIDISLNQQEEKKVFYKNQLFSSLDVHFRRIILPDKFEFLLLDTVGFIKKLPHELVEAFQSTLNEISYADLIINVVDGSSPHREMHEETTRQTLSRLECQHIPILQVMNKRDLVSDKPIHRPDHSSVQWISTRSKEDILLLAEKVKSITGKHAEESFFKIPYERFDLVELAYKAGQVREIEYQENWILIKGLFQKDPQKLMKWRVSNH